MDFDPDAYLAGPAAAPAPAFDPDQYLATPPFDPDAYLATPAPAKGGGMWEDIKRSWKQVAGTLVAAVTRPPDGVYDEYELDREGNEIPLGNFRASYEEGRAAGLRKPDALYDAAVATTKDAAAEHPLDPAYEQSLTHTITSGAVTAAPLLGAAALNPALGAGAGMMMFGQSMRQQAVDAGKPELADDMEMAGQALGVLGVLPYGNIIGGLKVGQPIVQRGVQTLAAGTGEAALRPIVANTLAKSMALGATKGAVSGATGMGLMTAGGNLAAREYGVDEERDLTAGLAESVVGGGILGIVFGAWAGSRGYKAEQRGWETLANAYAQEVPNDAVRSAVAAYGRNRSPENLATIIQQSNRTFAGLTPEAQADVLSGLARRLGIDPEVPAMKPANAKPAQSNQPAAAAPAGARTATAKSGVPPRASAQTAPAAAEGQAVTTGGPAVVIGAQGTEFPAAYAWMPRALLQSSHTGEMLAANPAYPLTNTRDYSDPAERDKALTTRNTWDPRLHFTDSLSAAVGLPIAARVIDEQGHATLITAGGNNRKWAIDNLTPAALAAHDAAADAAAPKYQLPPRPTPDAEATRFLGTFDFRQPGERSRLESAIDALNPSPGMVQSTAKRAEIDAATVPPDVLTGLTMEIAPADAQAFVRGLIEVGLADRNRTAAIAASGAQAQDYVQRVLVNAGFRQPSIAEARNDTRTGNATLRGLIDAAAPALVQLRQKGADDVADAIARAFTTTLNYVRDQGIEKLPQALDTVAAQAELDPAHAPAQAIAAALRARLVLNKAGSVQMEPTLEAARELFGKIDTAVAQHSAEPNLWGETRTLRETVQAAISPQQGESMTLREEPERLTWGDVQAGDRFDAVKSLIPKDPEALPTLDASGTMEEVAARVKSFMEANPVVTDPDGWKILLAHPEGRTGDRLLNRAKHLIAARETGLRQERAIFDVDKAKTVPAMLSTITAYHAKVRQGDEVLYFRRYRDGRLHMVVASQHGHASAHGFVDGDAITQYAPSKQKRFEGARIAALRRGPAAASGQAGAGETSTPQPSPADQTGNVPTQPEQGNPTPPPGTVNETLEAYLDAKGITDPARRAKAAEDLSRLAATLEDRQLEFRYETPTPTQTAPAGERRPGTAAERARAEALKRAVGGLRPAEVATLFAEGDTVSGLIAEAVNRHVGFDVRGARVETAKDAAALMLPLRTPWFESLKLLVLDDAGVVTHSEILHIGGLNWSDVSVQRIIQAVDMHGGGASRVIVSHNHPSGDVQPSAADRQVTDRLHTELGRAGIAVADHVITDGWGFFSFAGERMEAFPEAHMAPWEAALRQELPVIALGNSGLLAATLRGGDPAAVHVAYLSTRGGLLAFQRIDAAVKPAEFGERVRRQAAREGAYSVLVSVPDGATLTRLRAALGNLKESSTVKLLDVHTPAVASLAVLKWNFAEAQQLTEQHAAEMSLREDPAEYSPLHAFDERGDPYNVAVPLSPLPNHLTADMPELVHMITELMGAVPEIVRLRSARGQFHPIGQGRIKLDYRIFARQIGTAADHLSALKTLAHEFGHWTSYFSSASGSTMTRGNVLGHIHTLHKFLKGTYGPAGTRNKDVRAELIAWTRYWKPYDPARAPKSYVQYRESAAELYADAISGLFISPGELQRVAPRFWREMLRGLDTKPEFKDAYTELQSMLRQPEAVRMQAQRERLMTAQMKAEEIAERVRAQDEARRNSLPGRLSAFKQAFWNQFSPLVNKGTNAAARRELAFLFDEHPLADNKVTLFLNDLVQTVVLPLEEAGWTQDDLGWALFFDRVANERYEVEKQIGNDVVTETGGRSQLANPQGHTPESAAAQLAAYQAKPGWPALRAAMDAFHDRIYALMQEAEQAGLLTPEQMAIINQNRDHYAAFVPLKHFQGYVKSDFFTQRGTFEDVVNPYVATVLKAVTLHRAIQFNRLKTGIVGFMAAEMPGEIASAGTRTLPGGRREPLPPPRGQSQVMVRVAGKPQWYDVPPEIALMIEKTDVPLLDATVGFIGENFRRFIYPLWITYNPIFQFVSNPIRDARRSYVNAPEDVGLLAVLRQMPLVKQIGLNVPLKSVRDYVRAGVINPLIAEMLEHGAIVPAEMTWTATRGATSGQIIETQLEKFKVLPGGDGPPPWWRLLKQMETAGKMNELLPKVSIYRHLTTRLGWHPRDAAWVVRNHIGTPNWLRKGKHVNLANVFLPFANIWLRGYEGDAALASGGYQRTEMPTGKGKSAASWWLRWAMTSGLVALFKAAASIGLMGVAMKKLYDGIGRHDALNYDVLPLGRTGSTDFDTEGKVAYLRIPKDPTDRLISGSLYSGLLYAGRKAAQAGLFGEDIQRLNAGANPSLGQAVSEGIALGNADLPSVTPLLTVPGKWLQFSAGFNPIDDYRSSHILSETEDAAGGWERLKPMIGYTIGQTGLASWFSYKADADTTLEMVAQYAVPVKGLFRISDYGYREKALAHKDATAQQRALAMLSLPKEALRLNSEYYMLQHLGAAGRNPAQHRRYDRLRTWHNTVFTPAVDQLANADDNALTTTRRQAIREDVARRSRALDSARGQ